MSSPNSPNDNTESGYLLVESQDNSPTPRRRHLSVRSYQSHSYAPPQTPRSQPTVVNEFLQRLHQAQAPEMTPLPTPRRPARSASGYAETNPSPNHSVRSRMSVDSQRMIADERQRAQLAEARAAQAEADRQVFEDRIAALESALRGSLPAAVPPHALLMAPPTSTAPLSMGSQPNPLAFSPHFAPNLNLPPMPSSLRVPPSVHLSADLQAAPVANSQTAGFVAMPNVRGMEKPPTFSMDSDIRFWLRKVQDYFAVQQITDSRHQAVMARNWLAPTIDRRISNYQNIDNPAFNQTFQDWELLKNWLFSEYGPRHTDLEADDKMERIKQRPGQSVQDFTVFFEGLLQDCTWAGEAKAEASAYRRKLLPAIRQQIYTRLGLWPTTLADMKAAAISADIFLRSMDKVFAPRREGSPDSATSRPTPSTANPNNIPLGGVRTNKRKFTIVPDEERVELLSAGKCFRCKEKGHLSRDCNAESPKRARIESTIPENS